MRAKLLPLMVAAILAGASGSTAIADDGAINNKSMSRNAKLTVEPEEVGELVAEAEHAFIDMMKFYVPAQAASGEATPVPIYYENADGTLVETLYVAKPLVAVFIDGPVIGVADYPFGHSFMDAFGAISLDDGVTWKAVNLSESADLSSFTLDTDNSNEGNEGGESTNPGGGAGTGGGNANNLDRSGGKTGGEAANGGGANSSGVGVRSGGKTGGQAANASAQNSSGLTTRAKFPVKGLEDGDGFGPGDGTGLGGEGPEDGSGLGPTDGTGILAVSGAGNGTKVGNGSGGGVRPGGGDGSKAGKGQFLNLLAQAGGNGNGAGGGGNGVIQGNGDGSGSGGNAFGGRPDDDGDSDDAGVPVITHALWDAKNKNKGDLEVAGEGVDDDAEVTIINPVTDETLGSTEADVDGEFAFETEIKLTADKLLPPCSVAAVADGVESAPAIVVDEEGEPLEECAGEVEEEIDLTNYPGGVHNIFHATAGNKVLVAWPSRYCRSGSPAYAMEDADKDALATYLDINREEDLYLEDLFGVAGSQGSQDFADEGYPAAGEVPYGCVWAARGVLTPDPDNLENMKMVWFKAERLTSGRRDPNRIEVKAVEGAGFAMTWQEDPDGLRPGQGEGPGEGWSGAVAHDKTDVWYTFINWEYFDLVDSGTPGEPLELVDYLLANDEKPQPGVPMAVPVRITNNDKCVFPINPLDESYCNIDYAGPYGLQDFCVDQVEIPLGPQDTLTPICVNEDGLPNVANTASTRPRLGLQGFDSDGDGEIDDAWVVFAAEESKGLGKFGFLPDGTPCDVESDIEDCEEEIGKNQWYYSFHMGSPDSSADLATFGENSLVANVVSQGNLLNQPEMDWREGVLYPVRNTEYMWDFGEFNFDMYNTEIARRASLLIQGIAKAQASVNGLLAIPSWKQGIMRQGGPADTMLRRIYLPEEYNPQVDNPYAFENMYCEEWAYNEDEGGEYNPYYPKGVCLDAATNLSGVTPDTCVDSLDGSSEGCLPVLTCDATGEFCSSDTNPILQGSELEEPNTSKVLTWHQCPSAWTAADADEGVDPVSCDRDPYGGNNLNDQSWFNPLDISKGHRGFIDGDMVMFLYAWSPNWRLNAVGHDRYELYVRRSFDGANTWTTTPGGGLAGDGVTEFNGTGTVTCETYRGEETGGGNLVEPHVCYEFGAGVDEHARNITQHQAMNITTLDPRYAPTPASIDPLDCYDTEDPTYGDSITCDDTSDLDTDERDPSRYFMVFETGDNTTTAVGEAEPEDLYYSRAINFGDHYQVWAEEDDLSVCYPNTAYNDDKVIGTVVENSGFCNEFDRMNTGGDTHSSEANLEANPDGSKMYGVWTQWVFGEEEEVVESDAMARRIWWLDDYIPTDAWNGGEM